MSQATHDEIRTWVEVRGGRPAIVRTSGKDGSILRIDLQEPDGTFEKISWDGLVRILDQRNLAVLDQDGISDKKSRFTRIVYRSAAA